MLLNSMATFLMLQITQWITRSRIACACHMGPCNPIQFYSLQDAIDKRINDYTLIPGNPTSFVAILLAYIARARCAFAYD
jgi:hypothetical protein